MPKFRRLILRMAPPGLLLLWLTGCQTNPIQDFVQSLPTPPRSTTNAGASPHHPHPRIEVGMHTAAINHIAVDAAGCRLATVSDDKTARLWSLSADKRQSIQLARVLRPPLGDGNEGRLYAVAIAPDGERVAVAGRTRAGGETHNIYLFEPTSGQLVKRLGGLPHVITALAWSPDGRFLAAGLAGPNGIRVWETALWQPVGADPGYYTPDYGDDSYSVAFAHDGRLVSTSWDGYLRLYDPSMTLLAKAKAPGGERPFTARFSPDDQHIAVGFDDTPSVNVLSADDLSLSFTPDTEGVDNGDLAEVAWSRDGQRLYAAGRYVKDGKNPVRIWAESGRGPWREAPLAEDTIVGLALLADGDLAWGATDPAFGLLIRDKDKPPRRGATCRARTGTDMAREALPDPQGSVVPLGGGWTRIEHGPPLADLRDMHRHLLVSEDGGQIRFAFEPDGKRPTRFHLTERRLQPMDADDDLGPAPDGLRPPRTEAPDLAISDWEDTTAPTFDGEPLPLGDGEIARSLAIAPSGRHFLLGASETLRGFDSKGRQHWRTPVPGEVWGVNISGDGRLAVAALGDGTLRWYRMADGEELLALFPHPDGKRWALWTPEGFFDHGPGGERLIGYSLNRSPEAAGAFVPVDRIYDRLYRPDLVRARFIDDKDKRRVTRAKTDDVGQVLARGLPPAIEIVGPLAGTHRRPGSEADAPYRSTRRVLEIALRLTDRGGGIGRVVLRVDGVTVSQLAGRPENAAGAEGRIVAYRYPLTLSNGLHEITVSAFNGADQVASAPATARVRVKAPDQHPPRLMGLAVGIDDYRDPSLGLNYAVGDARAVAGALARRGVRLFDQVDIRVLTEAEANRAAIVAALEGLQKAMRATDVFVLYLSGHGLGQNGRYFFLPQEFLYRKKASLTQEALSGEALRDLMANIPAHKKVVILDTCHAGAGIPILGRFRTPLSALADPRRGGGRFAVRIALDRLGRATGSAILAATSERQPAVEGYREHGVFTHALLSGLAGGANRDRDRDVAVDELADYLHQQTPRLSMKKWGYEQSPTIQRVTGQSFPLVGAWGN